jgi:two-component system, OmpR family, response regulator
MAREENRLSTPLSPSADSPKLLVVEDDESIRELLASALRFAGYQAEAVPTGTDGFNRAITKRYDLLILDVGLPGIDGFEICRLLRARGDLTPVIFLTARRELDDMRAGFEGGGDDYLTKPFSLEELTLRVEAVLRRTANQHQLENQRNASSANQRGASLAGSASDSSDRIRTPVLRCGDLVVDEDQRKVLQGTQTVLLTPTEFRLLAYLLRNQGVVLSKDQILESVWGFDFEGDARIVETYVSSIRTKLDPKALAKIVTVRGFGYTVRVEDQQ